MDIARRPDTPVLIVGGGPIGLALAADLGRRGVAAVLVERNENRLGPAKMLEVSVRTMEFCRQLGIAEKVRNWGFPLDWPLDSAFVTDLAGYEIGRVRTPALGVAADSPFSPERGRPCPQTWFDPILQDCARSYPQIELRHQVALESFTHDPDGVTATLRDQRSGATGTLRAGYLVGCDGFASTVRERLGIAIRGEPHLDWSMTVYLRIPDLFAFCDKERAFRYVFVGPEGTWSFLSIVDGKDLWRLQHSSMSIPGACRAWTSRRWCAAAWAATSLTGSRTRACGSASAPSPSASARAASSSPATPLMRIRPTAGSA